jgi:hypothetical protein
VRGWLGYAIVSAVILALLTAGVVLVVPGTHSGSVWLAAVVAFAVQLAAFALLIAARRREHGFVAGWGGGMLLRFAAVAAMAGWVTVTEGYQAESALLGLIGFIMVLVLIEPLFLKLTD